MKGIIIYKGKYGATAQYASWLASALRLPSVKADNVEMNALSQADFVVMGSSVYIGRLQLKSWLNKNAAALQAKTLFLFIVCGTPADNKEALDKIVKDNVPDEIRSRCELFFLPGRVIKKKISLTDRLLLQVGALMTKDPAEKKRMLNDFDRVNAECLAPLINAVSRQEAARELVIAHEPLK